MNRIRIAELRAICGRLHQVDYASIRRDDLLALIEAVGAAHALLRHHGSGWLARQPKDLADGWRDAESRFDFSEAREA
jgi:hypothetical protein